MAVQPNLEAPGSSLRVLLAGGGSGGSVTPLIAVAERLRELSPGVELLLVGTRSGPEQELASAAGIPFDSIPSGKLRRYWSWENLTDFARVAAGFGASVKLVREFHPQVAVGAGGYASVPPLAAAALLGCPIHIHQQDVQIGLANRILSPLAQSYSVSLPASLAHFALDRTVLTGNPVRLSVLSGNASRAMAHFQLEAELPLVLAMGGGTGALGLNKIVAAAAPLLVEQCQLLHLTGVGRAVPAQADPPRYRQLELVTTQMADLLAAAAMVVGRAGMGTLSELAALGKPAVVVSMPSSHQQANAGYFASRGAVLVCEQDALTTEKLAEVVLSLLRAPEQLAELGRNMRDAMPQDAADRVAGIVLGLARRWAVKAR